MATNSVMAAQFQAALRLAQSANRISPCDAFSLLGLSLAAIFLRLCNIALELFNRCVDLWKMLYGKEEFRVHFVRRFFSLGIILSSLCFVCICMAC